MITRRRFLQTAAVAGAAASVSMRAQTLASREARDVRPFPGSDRDEKLITILHTNDTHSQIDPLPPNDRNAGRGGVARRATLVKAIRKENPNTLLVDAGDSFQGTPYFNLYKGEVEYKAMSAIGYDVVTLGNHDFDNGVGALAAAMKFATFEFVSANYDVSGTALANRVKSYTVRELSGVRVGLFGLGVKLEGLNTPDTWRGVKYTHPLEAAREAVRALRERERCALVVCISHMGYYPEPKEDDFGDSQLAAQLDGIDFIAGGHTHTFMRGPVVVRQPSGRETVVFQVGKSGINLGRVDFTIKNNCVAGYSARLLGLSSV